MIVTTGPLGIAVGTALVVDLGRPPHRSERAGLPHSALALGTGVEAFCFAHTVERTGRAKPPLRPGRVFLPRCPLGRPPPPRPLPGRQPAAARALLRDHS